MIKLRFWQGVAVVTWATCMILGTLCAILPPLNLILVPAFFFLASGAVGVISREIEAARRELVETGGLDRSRVDHLEVAPVHSTKRLNDAVHDG